MKARMARLLVAMICGIVPGVVGSVSTALAVDVSCKRIGRNLYECSSGKCFTSDESDPWKPTDCPEEPPFDPRYVA